MLTARDLSTRLADLLRRERAALADFLVALSEFDRERRWVELGHSSLFYFLHRELRLSKGAAFYRKTAAELIQKYPEVVAPLRDGRLCLTSVVQLAKVITPENRSEVLPRFFQLSKREAMEVSAELSPCEAAPHREVVTAVRAPSVAHSPALVPSPFTQTLSPREAGGEGSRERGEEPGFPDEPTPTVTAAPAPPPPRTPPSSVEPLTADLRRFHVTVSRRFLEKLEAARAALSHSHPGGSAEEILEAGLDLLLERHAKRRGLVEKPRREPPPAKPEHIPAHVKRAVWKRDQGRCQWPLASGGVCGSTHQVEFDHVIPRARGGPSTVENVRLACKFHNDLAAREVFGDAWMDLFTRGGAGPPPEDAPGPP